MGCSGPSFTNAQICDNVRVQSATLWSACGVKTHGPACAKITSCNLLRHIRCHAMCELTRTHCYAICQCYEWPMLRHVDFSLSVMFEITRARCYVMSHLLLCVHMGHSLLRHVHICFNISNGKNPKNENNARKVLKPEMLNVMSQRHRKTHTKRVFSKNPHVFANCFFKEGIAQTNAVIHHKMMVFTIPLLHAFERRKHCLQWMKIHFSAHL